MSKDAGKIERLDATLQSVFVLSFMYLMLLEEFGAQDTQEAQVATTALSMLVYVGRRLHESEFHNVELAKQFAKRAESEAILKMDLRSMVDAPITSPEADA